MISLQIYDTPALGSLLADFTSRLHPSAGGGGLRFGNNKHGFAMMEAPLIPMLLDDAFAVYDWPGTPHAVVSDQAAGVVWAGRLEDITVVDGGVRLGGFGYWRAMRDAPYTALWSVTSTAGWRVLSDDDFSTAVPERYEMDNNNRLYIAIRKNEQSSNVLTGMQGYIIPHNGERQITAVDFDFELTGASGYAAILARADGSWGFLSNIWSLATNGTVRTGSQSLTFAGCDSLIFTLRDNSATPVTFTGETGDTHLKITNIRIKTTTAASVLASDIAADLVTFANGVNSAQISAGSLLIDATSTDLEDELYEDLWPADVLNRLALLHEFEAAVWEGQRLQFRSKGQGESWYVDVTRIVQLQRSLENLKNSAYGVYKDPNGRILRTAVADDAASQTRFDIVRRGLVRVQTTSQTEAETHRDVWLTDRVDFSTRATIEFERLYDASGAEIPLYMLRTGDSVTMRNLPPMLSADIENIANFRVGETEYNAATNELSLTPEAAIPTLVTLISESIPYSVSSGPTRPGIGVSSGPTR